jgi:hypothetical protein
VLLWLSEALLLCSRQQHCCISLTFYIHSFAMNTMEPSAEGVEVQVVLAGQQVSAAAQKLAEHASAQVNTTQASAPVPTNSCTSPDRCWSSQSFWTAFALGWLFPPCWWAAAAAGLKSGGDRQCLVLKRRCLNPSQAAAWRASVLMSVLSAVVLVLVLSIYYGQPGAPQDGKLH